MKSLLMAAALCILVVSICAMGRPQSDRVDYVPGFQGPLSFEMYSGYLPGRTENIQLHYFFVEAEKYSDVSPLVLWLNGGPGCSSLLGMLNENGPLRIHANGHLQVNKFSWNKYANILYLEAPAGVGFSFARDGNITTDDDMVADNNVFALKNFFKRFPEFKDRDFFIIGESYGGVYVPTLSLLVVNHTEMRLKGIAVDNGLTSYVLNDNSLLYFAYYHSLLDASLWENLVEYCCGGVLAGRCLFTLNPNADCQSAITRASGIISQGLNMYNLYAPCDGGVPPAETPTPAGRHGRIENDRISRKQGRGSSIFTREHADRGNLFRFSTAGRNTALNNKLEIACSNDSILTEYLNRPDVRAAFHIPDSVKDWATCDADVYNEYVRVYRDLRPQYTSLLNHGVRIHLFNGDVDMACNALGDEWFVNDLYMPLVSPRHAWFYKSIDNTRQIGGYTKTFQLPSSVTNLTFSTVRGAGHMVPQDKPVPALTLFVNFLNNRYE